MLQVREITGDTSVETERMFREGLRSLLCGEDLVGGTS